MLHLKNSQDNIVALTLTFPFKQNLSIKDDINYCFLTNEYNAESI